MYDDVQFMLHDIGGHLLLPVLATQRHHINFFPMCSKQGAFTADFEPFLDFLSCTSALVDRLLHENAMQNFILLQELITVVDEL